MSGFGDTFVGRLTIETTALYAVGIFLVGLRLYARTRTQGWRGLLSDDYLMLVATGFYTMLIVCLNLTARAPGTALALPGEDVDALTQPEINARVLGAKIDLLAEQAMLNTIWCLKGCMLMLYHRLTLNTRRNIWVKILAVYIVLGYIACQLTWFLECRPFWKYWQIRPTPNINCEVLYTYAAVQCTFNISSDIAMLFVPIPLLLGVNIPMRRKLVLLFVFGMGLFVIAAALCTKIEFWISIYSPQYMFWYTRESSVAMYIANVPTIWPLVKDAVPYMRSMSGTILSRTTPSRTANSQLRNERLDSTAKTTKSKFASMGSRSPTNQDIELGQGGNSTLTTTWHSRDSDESSLIDNRNGIFTHTTIHFSSEKH